MAIADAVRHDLESAMRAGERSRVGALRMVLSELQRAAKEGNDDEVAVLRRERKRRLEAAQAYHDGGREDLASAEETEASMISAYLPAELPDEELQAIVTSVVAESGAQTMKDMGRVMSQVMSAVGGRADGRRVSEQVKAALTE
jgi:uncharacterized protein YqeY